MRYTDEVTVTVTVDQLVELLVGVAMRIDRLVDRAQNGEDVQARIAELVVIDDRLRESWKAPPL